MGSLLSLRPASLLIGEIRSFGKALFSRRLSLFLVYFSGGPSAVAACRAVRQQCIRPDCPAPLRDAP